MSRVSLIWAMDEDGVIGIENRLPWHLPADLKRFRQLTTGHHILMGRKTFESLKAPLPDRTHVIITKDRAYRAPEGCHVVHSIDAALDKAGDDEHPFVIGGASLFKQVLPLAQRLYVTRIHARFAGDAWFPPIDWTQWRETEREDHAPDERNAYAYTFQTLERV